MPAIQPETRDAVFQVVDRQPVAVCAASACAERLARLEADADAAERDIARELAAAAFTPGPDVFPRLHALEARRDALLLEADAARDALAAVQATTCAGAAAQLLAAIRDVRAGDDAERRRARTLERHARRFFAASGVLAQPVSRAISQSVAR